MVFHESHGMNQPLFSMRTLYVSRTPADTSAYPTISAALDAIPMDSNEPTCICLTPGIYHEKLTIDKPYVTLRGTGKSNKDVVLTYDDYALAPMADIGKLGTFRSYSVFIDAHDVTLQNLTIENASGDSLTHGQAIALYADGDRLVIDSCRLIGHQDTLFTGPLPPKEIEPDGFIGPKQFAPRINGRQYYKNCYICGDIDFIFGSATAYFENCVLESLHRTPNVNDIQGYITAASTPEGQEYGYVFSHCKLISENCPPNSVYLGRPWRNYAKTVFLECSLGDHIHECGFHDWKKEDARNTVLYAEYRNYPASSAGTASDNRFRNDDIHCIDGRCTPYPHRAEYVCELDAVQAKHFSRENVLSGADHWNP